MPQQTKHLADLFRAVCLFVCGIWPKLMNGFPWIELGGLSNNKAVCQQVLCLAAGLRENLRTFYTDCHLQMMQEKILKIKGWRIIFQNLTNPSFLNFYFLLLVLLIAVTTNRSSKSRFALWMLLADLLTAVEEAITGGGPGSVVRDRLSQGETSDKPSDVALTLSSLSRLCVFPKVFWIEKQNYVNMLMAVGGGCLPLASSCLITAELH